MDTIKLVYHVTPEAFPNVIGVLQEARGVQFVGAVLLRGPITNKSPKQTKHGGTAVCHYCGKEFVGGSAYNAAQSVKAHLKNCPEYNASKG